MILKLRNPYRSPEEYQAWLRGVRDVAQALDIFVDADTFGGGIPDFLTLTVPDVPIEEIVDGYFGEKDADTAAVPDSPGPALDSEPEPPTGGCALES